MVHNRSLFRLGTVLDCPSGMDVIYNGGTSFCIERMSSANCSDMQTICETKHGPKAKILQIQTADVFEDVVRTWISVT